MKFILKTFCYFLIFFVLVGCNSKTKVDCIVHHAKIFTVDKNFNLAEAMAIKDGKILAIGSNDSILKYFTSHNLIDVKNNFIYPGFIDAHCHFTGYATDLWKCSLYGTASFEEIIELLKTYSQTCKTTWIYGTGWDQNDWKIKNFPNKKILDSLFPNKPVFLKRVDGHAALVNQAALSLAGISSNSKINGGEIEIQNGKLTGILMDNAMDLVDKIIPSLPDTQTLKFYEQVQQKCIGQGLTSIQDCGINDHTISLIQQGYASNKLKIKIYALLSDSANYYEEWLKKGIYKSSRFTVGGFKIYADGALGSRGACLLQPYSDKKNWYGFLLNNQTHYDSVFQLLIKSPFQVCTHAIGDSGNRVILKLYSKYLPKNNDRRWRIEHAQVVNNNDYFYFKDYKIIPSVQPTHATSDMYWVAERLGLQREKNAYVYQDLLLQNGWIPLGTDFPVEDISPLKTFYAAVTRQDAKEYPTQGFQINNALTRQQALYGITYWAAKAAFEENEKGSLEVGKSADFVLLNTNLMTCKKLNILSTKVLSTFINGEKVYEQVY